MSRYSPDSKERVRDAVDMLTLVGGKTELRRAGVNSYFGRCPFHEERTGSFHVRPEEKHYHCFGCQESGDPFDFVMQTEGLDFRGALESLAERFGITLEVEDEDPLAKARRDRRDRLHALLDRAAGYYARYLWESAEAAGARDYLARRGLEEEALRTFRVGYAPSAWDKMLMGSRQAGFSEEELLATGLAQRSRQRPGSYYDRFRERIMFPLSNARGKVVGFGARAMRDNQPPKYLNTSEGEVFHKGSQLFGIDVARRPAARAGTIVLAEGYTDVIALHQAGVQNAVGVMGTSLTEEQVRELERTARTLVLALDADGAGQEAMVRASRIAAGRRLELRVARLADGMDPADIVQQQGAAAVRELVARSVPFVSFHVDKILAGASLSDAEDKDRALAELGPVLAAQPPSVLREDLIGRIAGRLGIAVPLATQLLERAAEEAPEPSATPASREREPAAEVEDYYDPGPDPAWQPPPDDYAHEPEPMGPPLTTVTTTRVVAARERMFLTLCIALPREGAEAIRRLDHDRHLTSDVTRRAATHLSADGRLESPTTDLPASGPLRDFVVELEQESLQREVSPDSLELAWTSLELDRLRREIAHERALGQGGVEQLGREWNRVVSESKRLYERIQSRG
ncbi:DNA primase [Conexibacter sp. CPCC 206217]|uniref:DNA primase n=1 Tax=Conexibacter sp. CPCC 206217 TaxID=3064574 RepID=UPI00272450A3|nr:DNA primase [Conexibacter sp. CPCC 206217]MDO8210784.1 DNA primase [Conexibacter sp. CPCC 206217]